MNRLEALEATQEASSSTAASPDYSEYFKTMAESLEKVAEKRFEPVSDNQLLRVL
jgi:hypothetical protein